MSSHEFLDHTGETVLRVRADSLPDLFAEAAVALGDVERAGITPLGQAIGKRLTLTGPDLPSLLVDWLNELVFLSETERAVPCSATVEIEDGHRLTAEIGLNRIARRPALVKAATHHGLRLERQQGGWVAEVTLDV